MPIARRRTPAPPALQLAVNAARGILTDDGLDRLDDLDGPDDVADVGLRGQRPDPRHN